MADEETNIIQQTIRAFQGLTTIQKSMVISISAILVLSLAGLLVWASQEPMGLLVTNLNPSDASTIVETLEKQNEKYEIGRDKQSIYVRQKRVAALTIQIMGEGNLTGERVGWEKLETPGLTMTDFSQKTTYWRAMERAIGKNLRDGLPSYILNARVQITPANDSIYSSEKEDAKASVFLELKRKALPPEDTIQGILHFVAGAVDGLKPDGVVLMDQHGRFLSKKELASTINEQITETQKNMQRDQEELLTKKVIELLEPVVGKGKVRAQASIELDFDKIQIKEKTVDPQSQIERAVDQAQAKIVRREEPLGVPGTPTNIAPANPGLDNRNIIISEDRSHSTINYELSETNRAIEKSPGSTKRVSLAVLLDYKASYVEKTPGKSDFELQYVEWTEEEMLKYRNQVAAAAGIDVNRGDFISVESVNFAPTVSPIEEAAARRLYWINLGKFLAPFVLLFLSALVWFIYKLATRKKVIQTEEATMLHVEEEEAAMPPEPKVIVPPKTLEELKAEIENELNAESASQAPEAQRREVIKQRVSEIITADPENAASLVRSWLVDDEAK
ncbi:MAG: flagellar M-ring protein FliF [Holophagaceae bacterium]|nr:flagellar M-ring protein FliF [Holophagaceae bacterium]